MSVTTTSGKSGKFETKFFHLVYEEEFGIVKGHFGPINRLYADGHDLAHPYLSPLHGDFSKGYPPTLITTGTRDFFLSSCALMHR